MPHFHSATPALRDRDGDAKAEIETEALGGDRNKLRAKEAKAGRRKDRDREG